MKKYILSFGLFVFGLFFITNTAFAATIFSENFGTGSGTSSMPSGWSEGGNGGDDAELRNASSGNDSASPDGGRFAVALGDGGYFCRTINTTGYNAVALSYYWRGDDDAGSSTDDAKVEIKPSSGNNCSDGSGWTELKDHDMQDDNSWTTQSAFTNAGMNNTSFLIRFRVSTNQSDEHFRVDGILITGTAIATTGSLTVTKNTIGGNATFAFTGGAGAFNITTTGGTGSTTRTNLTPGTYTVTETAQSGWDITSNTCGSVVVTAGNTATCTITNTKRGSITVSKNVLNPDNAEVADNHSFSVTLNGSNAHSISENSSYTYTNLVPGLYTVAEAVDGDYTFVSYSSDSDAETSGAQVTVVAGTNLNLTITNKQKKGNVTVNKIVTNPNGGEAVAGDFWFKINEDSPIQFIQNEMDALLGSNSLTLNPGNYLITENLPMGAYAISYSGCNFVLVSNANQNCTITNSDIPAGKGAITVIKHVIINNGGTKTSSDFSLYITPSEGEMMSVTSGESNFLNPGTYTISEGALPHGYTHVSTVCVNGESTTSGTVNLSEQTAWTCTITNQDMPAHLTVVKHAVNPAWHGTLDDTFEFNLSSQEDPFSITTEEGTGEETFTLNKGSYTISEILNNDWNLTSVSCNYDEESEEGQSVENGEYVTLDNGDDVTCTFTNTRKTGTLLIKKTVVNDDNQQSLHAGDFGFTISGSSVIPFIQDEEDVFKGSKSVILEEGVYYISEPVTEGYFKVPENCDAVSIMDGDEKICSFRNDDVGFFQHGGGSGGGGAVAGAFIDNSAEAPTSTPSEPEPEGQVLGATSCSTKLLENFLYYGKKNKKEDVNILQTFLNQNLGLTLQIDGFYGKSTRDAVSSFQEKYKTEVLDPWIPFGKKDGKGTGNVYKTTLRWINMLHCPDLNLPMPILP